MDVLTIILNILVILVLIGIGFFIKNYIPSYFNEKGKNLATKEDFNQIIDQNKAITETNENIKILLSQKDIVSRNKWEFKKMLMRTLFQD